MTYVANVLEGSMTGRADMICSRLVPFYYFTVVNYCVSDPYIICMYICMIHES